jgi:hypothetical protein
VHRSVEGPRKVWLNAKDAAAWLGLGDGEFKSEVKARPDLLPFQDIGNGRKWYWMDLVVYAYLRSQGRVIGTEAPPPPALKNQPGGGKAEKS